MNKSQGTFWTIIAVLVALIFGLIIGWLAGKAGLKECEAEITPLNASYTIEGEIFLLDEGQSSTDSKVKVAAWGDPIFGALNTDDQDDAAMIFTYNGGGSGTFYYVAAALKDKGKGYTGTNSILLGDRINPDTITIDDGNITVSYFDRKSGESMTTKPSVKIVRKFFVGSGVLLEAN